MAYQKKATNKEITIKIKTGENFNYLLEEITRIRKNWKNIGKQVGALTISAVRQVKWH